MVEEEVLEPNKFQISYHNLLVKRGSRSWMSSFGTPKCLMILIKTNFATFAALNTSSPIKHGISFTYLLRQSTIVKIQLQLLVRGKCDTKSSVQLTNLPGGTGNGYKAPCGNVVLSFVTAHTAQFLQYVETSLRI